LVERHGKASLGLVGKAWQSIPRSCLKGMANHAKVLQERHGKSHQGLAGKA